MENTEKNLKTCIKNFFIDYCNLFWWILKKDSYYENNYLKIYDENINKMNEIYSEFKKSKELEQNFDIDEWIDKEKFLSYMEDHKINDGLNSVNSYINSLPENSPVKIYKDDFEKIQKRLASIKSIIMMSKNTYINNNEKLITTMNELITEIVDNLRKNLENIKYFKLEELDK